MIILNMLLLYFLKTSKYFKILSSSISIFILFLFFGKKLQDYKIQVTLNNANKIINELKDYKKTKGYYPNNIYFLEQKTYLKNFIDVFPKSFFYEVTDDDYLLIFECYRYTKTYSSQNSKWLYED